MDDDDSDDDGLLCKNLQSFFPFNFMFLSLQRMPKSEITIMELLFHIKFVKVLFYLRYFGLKWEIGVTFFSEACWVSHY